MRARLAPSPLPALGLLLAFTGVVLLLVHLQLHPVPLSPRELRDDPPEGSREVLVTTDSAWAVGEREELPLACVDDGCTIVLRVYPNFTGRQGYSDLWAFTAVWPDDPKWEPITVEPYGPGSARETVVPTNVVFEYAMIEPPPPFLALGAAAALVGALVALGLPYGAAGVAAALGFAAHHAVALTPYLVPRLGVSAFAWTVGVAGAAVLLGSLWKERWGHVRPTGAVLLAFALGAWLEHRLFHGYRPFTGIL